MELRTLPEVDEEEEEEYDDEEGGDKGSSHS